MKTKKKEKKEGKEKRKKNAAQFCKVFNSQSCWNEERKQDLRNNYNDFHRFYTQLNMSTRTKIVNVKISTQKHDRRYRKA